MKMKVYKGKPIGVNVLSFDTYANTSLPYALECNYKFVSPLTITVEAPYPFYYAVFEDNTHWRASKISYLTNTKVVVTLENQDIWDGDSVTDTCSVSGSINTEHINAGIFFSTGGVLDEPSVKPYVTRTRVDTNLEQVCIFQTTQGLEVLLAEVYEGVAGAPVYQLTSSGGSKDTKYIINEPSATHPVEGTMGGVFTYMFKLPIINYENIWFNLVSMLADLAAHTKAGVFINARYVKLPTTFVNYITAASSVGSIVSGDNNYGSVYNILKFPSNEVLTLDTISDVSLVGDKRWNYNNHYIYPMSYNLSYNLYGRINLGVGTIYLTLYSGDYLQASYTGNTFTTEIGFNLVPAIVNPSLYSSSTEYQALIDGLVWSQMGTALTAPVGGIAAGLGVAAMTNPAIGVAVGGVTALGMAIRGSQGVKSAKRMQMQEAFNKTTVNQVADVLKITQYQAVFDIIYRESLNIYATPRLLQPIIETYSAFIGSEETKSYRLTDSLYGYEKVYACTGNKNSIMLQTGCIVQGTRTLLQILEVL